MEDVDDNNDDMQQLQGVLDVGHFSWYDDVVEQDKEQQDLNKKDEHDEERTEEERDLEENSKEKIKQKKPSGMSGKGRGRGWLKLDKQQPDGKPGVGTTLPSPASETTLSPKSVPDVIPQFEQIVDRIMQFDENDDGIMINRKFHNIVHVMKENCSSDEETRHMLNYIYTKVLHDSQYLEKFLVLVTLNSFRSVNVNEVRLRFALLEMMQGVYESAADLMQRDKVSFHNSIKFLGGFYDKATMEHSNSDCYYQIFARPLLQYLEMLLNCGQPDDIELFTNQLYLNGYKIMMSERVRNTQMQELLNNVRSQIISNTTQDISKAWLLLALDLANNEYRILPSELLNYYQVKLGDKAMNNLQKRLNALSIQTPPSSKFAPMSSDVNVLQVDTTVKPPPPVVQQQNHYHSGNKSPNMQQSSEKQQQQPFKNWEENGDRKKQPNNGRHGRPILGAGARTHNKESASRQKPRPNNDGTGGWGDAKFPNRNAPPPEFRSAKGRWEHDDRFDTDYN